MSYCRWSSDKGYCDVYVYEDVSGGWTTHVASKRRPKGRPDGYLEVIERQFKAATELDTQACADAASIQEKWDEENPPFDIEHVEAGESFNHAEPGECADNLERLRREGFQVPQYAIDGLREDQAMLDATMTRPTGG
jgi:hypothetical protein